MEIPPLAPVQWPRAGRLPTPGPVSSPLPPAEVRRPEPRDVASEGPQDGVVRALEARISTARLTPQQKDAARRMVAMSLAELGDPRHLPKVVSALQALIDAWEAANEGRRIEKEDPDKVRRIVDYLADHAEAHRGPDVEPPPASTASTAELAGSKSDMDDRNASQSAGDVHGGLRVGGRLDVVA
jgi:hypothetical protein